MSSNDWSCQIVQTPGGISIFYDVGQGQGWHRNIVMDGSPHLPASIRQWFGDCAAAGRATRAAGIVNCGASARISRAALRSFSPASSGVPD